MLRHFRYIALVGAALAAAPLAPAEAQSAQFGLLAGGSLSTFTGDLVDDAKNYSSFIAGAFVRLEFMGFAVEPGAFYTRKGAKLPDTEGVSATNALSYMQVPVVLKLGMPLGSSSRFYIGGGPAIGFKLSCKFKASADGISASTDCEDLEDLTGDLIQAKSSEMSAIAVAGVDLGKFSLGVRADLGLTNVYEAFASGGTTVEPEVKTRTISAVASIRF